MDRVTVFGLLEALKWSRPRMDVVEIGHIPERSSSAAYTALLMGWKLHYEHENPDKASPVLVYTHQSELEDALSVRLYGECALGPFMVSLAASETDVLARFFFQGAICCGSIRASREAPMIVRTAQETEVLVVLGRSIEVFAEGTQKAGDLNMARDVIAIVKESIGEDFEVEIMFKMGEEEDV